MSRTARLLAPWTTTENPEQRPAIYHVVSRIVGREFLLACAPWREVPPRRDHAISNTQLLAC